MNNETLEVPIDDYYQLLKAISKMVEPELEKLALASITALKKMDPFGFFDDIYAGNFWDEYCWQLDQGPFDINYMGLGTVGDGFEDVLDTAVMAEINKLSAHTQLILSIYSRDELDPGNDMDIFSGIFLDEITTVIKKRVDQYAMKRNIDLIGPDRLEEIAMEVSIEGIAGEALSDMDMKTEFLSDYADQMLEGGADNISEISHALLEVYIELIGEDQDAYLLPTLFKRFEKEIKQMVLEKDIYPSVEAAINQLDNM